MRRSAELPTASDWAETRRDGRQDLSRCCRVTRDQYGGRQQSLYRMSSSYEVRPRFRQSKSKSDQIKFQRPFMPHLRLTQIRVVRPPQAAPGASLRGHCAMRWRTSGISTSPPNRAINVSLRYWPRRGHRWRRATPCDTAIRRASACHRSFQLPHSLFAAATLHTRRRWFFRRLGGFGGVSKSRYAV
jgi:hypothetical protein